jgi:transporter family-2 protein
MIFFLVLVTVLIGALMPFQAGINAELGRALRHPFLGAFYSFFSGTVVLAGLALVQRAPMTEFKRLTAINPLYLTGGLMGALFVGSSIFLIPRLGATTMIAAFVTGQLLMSVVIDHYGWLGLPAQPVSVIRVLGVLLLFVGLFLVVRKTA